MIFDIEPLVGPQPICFGMTEEEVEQVVGTPQSKDVKRHGETRWDYDNFNVTFDGGRRGVVEVSFLPEVKVRIYGIDLFNDPSAFQLVLQKGHKAFEDYGFIVIPGIGLAFTGFHDGDEDHKAITVFEKGRWDRRASAFVPYTPSP